ncbi:uncharacterized protein METZ01_LOCUS63609, partial [marine metagenome]
VNYEFTKDTYIFDCDMSSRPKGEI